MLRPVYVNPLPIFSFGGATLFLILGVAMLVTWGRARSSDSPRLRSGVFAAAVVAFAMASALTTVDIYRFSESDRYINTFEFRYTIHLRSDYTGLSRIALPVPIEEGLLSGLVVGPSSASASFNRSGVELSLDVVFTDNATLTASLARYRVGSEANLSYARDFGECENYLEDCWSELEVTVLSGDVRDVGVKMDVTWAYGCTSHSWGLDVVALPGRHSYLGSWSAMAC